MNPTAIAAALTSSVIHSPSRPLDVAGACVAARPLVMALPPIHRGERADSLTPPQRRLMVAGIVVAHAAGVWGLLQIDAVREAVHEAAPMFVDLITPPAPPVPPVPPPPAPQPVVQKKPPPPARVIAAAPSPVPSSFVVAAPPPPEPVVAAPAPAVAVIVPPAPAPAPAPPAPQVIPPSAVQYLVEPAPDYPRLSARNGEFGRVLVLVFIDEAGAPREVQVAKSSGFARLDGSAVAAVQRARFKPPTLNGRPISGWANVPIDFGLEK